MAQVNTVTSGQQSIPAELMPYFTGDQGLLPKSQEIFARNYATAYGDPLKTAGLEGAGRIAGLSAAELAAQKQIEGLAQPGQYGTATGAMGQGLGALAGMTSPSQTAMYMSPYQQNVIDVNKAEALRDAQKGLVSNNLMAGKQGTYGGARQLLAQTELDRNLQTKLGTIQSQGMQSAFDAAQKAQIASAQGYGQLGSQLGTLGGQQQSSDIARATALAATGGTERSVGQQALDAQYQDQMRALGFPAEQLGSMSNMLRGVPLGDTMGTQTTTTPPPSFASQLAGVGLGGISLANMLK